MVIMWWSIRATSWRDDDLDNCEELLPCHSFSLLVTSCVWRIYDIWDKDKRSVKVRIWFARWLYDDHHNIGATSWRDDDLDNSEQLLPCHSILNGPKCWYQSPYTTIGHTQYTQYNTMKYNVKCCRIWPLVTHNVVEEVWVSPFTLTHHHQTLLWPVFEYLMA